jgi:glucose/arabinose dehydrogenase
MPKVSLERLADVPSALGMAIRADDPALYVSTQDGTVVAIRDGQVRSSPVLDLSDQISVGGEQGLLGLAFSPDGRYLYVNDTDLNGNTNVVEFAMGSDGRADLQSRREVLFVEQPFANHNGGNLVFGPDGDLYIGLGDGGSGGDPFGNGQNLGVLLGKMLRIEPRLPDGSVPQGQRPYAVPPDNPFVSRAGARPEIWAYGLRNPWRYEFDRQTGDLWIADVGQGEYEEVDFQPASSRGGQHYGWNLTEGTHPYEGHTPPSNWTRPLFDYSHENGRCTVVGGFVYRGSSIPSLDGWYLYADFCEGELMAARRVGGRVERRDLGLNISSPSSFGQDADGELYVLSLGGPIYRLVP